MRWESGSDASAIRLTRLLERIELARQHKHGLAQAVQSAPDANQVDRRQNTFRDTIDLCIRIASSLGRETVSQLSVRGGDARHQVAEF